MTLILNQYTIYVNFQTGHVKQTILKRHEYKQKLKSTTEMSHNYCYSS